MRKVLISIYMIALLLVALVTYSFAFITNNSVGISGINVKVDSSFASGVVFSNGEETRNLNANLSNMQPVVNKGFYFYFNEEDEDNLSGEGLTNNVVYENLLLVSLNGEKTLKVKEIEFINATDEIAKSLRVAIQVLDDFYVYNITTNEFNQTFNHKLTEDISVVSVYVWFEKTDSNCTAYNISQANESIGINITLGVE